MESTSLAHLLRSSSLDYVGLRNRTRRAVARSLPLIGAEAVLAGSFSFADFHLAVDGRDSRSDVDVVCARVGLADRLRLEKVAGDWIFAETGLRLRVSIHEESRFSELTASDARFLAIGEYLRRLRSGEGNYLRAKISLLLARSEQRERYSETALRVGTNEAFQAATVKIGTKTEFTVESTIRLLAGRNAEGDIFLHECVERLPIPQFVDTYLDALADRVAVPKELRLRLDGVIRAAHPPR